jgi:hypothetical protein
MHFRLVANNDPRIWTKHAGVEVEPMQNQPHLRYPIFLS